MNKDISIDVKDKFYVEAIKEAVRESLGLEPSVYELDRQDLAELLSK